MAENITTFEKHHAEEEERARDDPSQLGEDEIEEDYSKMVPPPAGEERRTHSPSPPVADNFEDALADMTSEQIQNDAHQRMAELDRADGERTEVGGEPLTTGALEGNTFSAGDYIFSDDEESPHPSIEEGLREIDRIEADRAREQAAQRESAEAESVASASERDKTPAELSTPRAQMSWSVYEKRPPPQGQWYSYSAEAWASLQPETKKKIQHVERIQGGMGEAALIRCKRCIDRKFECRVYSAEHKKTYGPACARCRKAARLCVVTVDLTNDDAAEETAEMPPPRSTRSRGDKATPVKDLKRAPKRPLYVSDSDDSLPRLGALTKGESRAKKPKHAKSGGSLGAERSFRARLAASQTQGFRDPYSIGARGRGAGADEAVDGVERAIATMSEELAKMATSMDLMKRRVGAIERAIELREGSG